MVRPSITNLPKELFSPTGTRGINMKRLAIFPAVVTLALFASVVHPVSTKDTWTSVMAYPQKTATKMRAESKKAIELRPDFPGAYELLAFINLVADTQLDKGAPNEQDPAEVKIDPYSYLQEALRKPDKGEKQVLGVLTRIDCDARSGITFVIKVGDRTLRLRTDRFENVQITTFTPDVAGDITCGIRKPENLVVMCYVPIKAPRAKAGGTAKSLEFVPRDFKLKSEP